MIFGLATPAGFWWTLGMSLGRHTIYNIAGSIAPMFVTVVTVPIYLHLVGNTR